MDEFRGDNDLKYSGTELNSCHSSSYLSFGLYSRTMEFTLRTNTPDIYAPLISCSLCSFTQVTYLASHLARSVGFLAPKRSQKANFWRRHVQMFAHASQQLVRTYVLYETHLVHNELCIRLRWYHTLRAMSIKENREDFHMEGAWAGCSCTVRKSKQKPKVNKLFPKLTRKWCFKPRLRQGGRARLLHGCWQAWQCLSLFVYYTRIYHFIQFHPGDQ